MTLGRSPQRRTAIGRRNWLFAGSDEATRRFAIPAHLIVNCDLVGAPLRVTPAKSSGTSPTIGPWPGSVNCCPPRWLANQRRQQLPANRAADSGVDAAA